MKYYIFAFIVVSSLTWFDKNTWPISLLVITFTASRHLLEFWDRKQTVIDKMEKRINAQEQWQDATNKTLNFVRGELTRFTGRSQ